MALIDENSIASQHALDSELFGEAYLSLKEELSKFNFTTDGFAEVSLKDIFAKYDAILLDGISPTRNIISKVNELEVQNEKLQSHIKGFALKVQSLETDIKHYQGREERLEQELREADQIILKAGKYNGLGPETLERIGDLIDDADAVLYWWARYSDEENEHQRALMFAKVGLCISDLKLSHVNYWAAKEKERNFDVGDL